MNKHELSKIHVSKKNRIPDGSFKSPFIDSKMSRDEIENYILAKNPEAKEVTSRLELLDVMYLNKDGKFCNGQIMVDKLLAPEVSDLFQFMLNQKFKIDKVVPIQDKKYNADDEASMRDNNSSATNYRYIAEATRLSLHSFGFALDLNPLDNPVMIEDEILAPEGAVRDESDPQTFTPEHPVVKWLEEHGWEWGGSWIDPYSDYHHFQKPLATEQYITELDRQLENKDITQQEYDLLLINAERNFDLVKQNK